MPYKQAQWFRWNYEILSSLTRIYDDDDDHDDDDNNYIVFLMFKTHHKNWRCWQLKKRQANGTIAAHTHKHTHTRSTLKYIHWVESTIKCVTQRVIKPIWVWCSWCCCCGRCLAKLFVCALCFFPSFSTVQQNYDVTVVKCERESAAAATEKK